MHAGMELDEVRKEQMEKYGVPTGVMLLKELYESANKIGELFAKRQELRIKIGDVERNMKDVEAMGEEFGADADFENDYELADLATELDKYEDRLEVAKALAENRCRGGGSRRRPQTRR